MDAFWWVLMLICTAPIWLPCLALICVSLFVSVVDAFEAWSGR